VSASTKRTDIYFDGLSDSKNVVAGIYDIQGGSCDDNEIFPDVLVYKKGIQLYFINPDNNVETCVAGLIGWRFRLSRWTDEKYLKRAQMEPERLVFWSKYTRSDIETTN
jgi:hypothetical protein